jgi:hypothetical protein
MNDAAGMRVKFAAEEELMIKFQVRVVPFASHEHSSPSGL